MSTTTPATGARARARAQAQLEAEHTRRLTLGHGPTGRTVAYATVAVLAAVWALPMVWAVLSSLKSEADVSAAEGAFRAAHGKEYWQ